MISLFKQLKFFVLIFNLIFFDQLSKFLIDKFVPLNTIYMSFIGDFFRIIHVRNIGILFSIGSNLSSGIKNIMFVIIPVVVLILVLFYLLQEDNKLLKIAFCFIFSGGIGNIVDRIFRTLGVIDFLDVKFYGIFGLERWPTFNLADIYVLFGISLYISSDLIFKRNS